MPRPDLSNAAERSAYRRELMAVAPGIRRSGVALAMIGALVFYLQRSGKLAVPGWLPAAIIVTAFVLMLTSIYLRTRYHHRRMRGD